jgi:hypothetical protein
MNGKLLGARFRIPLALIKEPERTIAILDAATKSPYHVVDKRSVAKARHYIAWSPSAPSPFISADNTHQLPHSQSYIEANKQIWERISN